MNGKLNANHSSNLVELKPNKALIALKDTNKVVLSLLGLTGGLLLSFLMILILLVNNNRLAAREKIFVETLNGKTQQAVEKDALFRSNEVIHEFVTNWLYLTYELDSRIPNSTEHDGGVEIEYQKEELKIPSKTYTASYAIIDGFREEFLKKFAEFVPNEFYSGEFISVLRIYHISEPIRKKDNTYHVKVMATRIDKASSGEKGGVKFNKTIVLKPIEPYRQTTDEPSAFRNFLENKLLKSGLLITSIENYEQ